VIIDFLQLKLVAQIVAAYLYFGSQMAVDFSQVSIFVLESIAGNNMLCHVAPFRLCAILDNFC
jgi:hypothetical protein